MPKGVYDRSKAQKRNSKKNGAATTAPVAQKAKPGRKPRAAATASASPPVPTVAKVVAVKGKTTKEKVVKAAAKTEAPRELDVRERFSIIRDNITTLAQVRGSLSADAARQADTELAAELALMVDLRRQYFGFGDSGEQEVVSERLVTTRDNATPVPLPPPLPNIPVPPVPASS